MGLDVTYQAIPVGGPLMDVIVSDPQAWNDRLWAVIPWSLQTADPFHRETLARPEVQALLAVMPSPGDWQYALGSRSQDKLEWVLATPADRALATYAERERTLAYRVVHGDTAVAPHVKGGQGIPHRQSSPDFLAQAVPWLQALEAPDRQAELRAAFDPREMMAAGTYKARGTETFDDLWAEVRALCGFFARVVEAGHQVIVQSD